jgi:serine phosphatase RsbU (regulator of sigma subunit)
LPFPIRIQHTDQPLDTGGPAAQIEMPGVPIGTFAGTTYDEIRLDLQVGDLFVFCSDGVFEANDLLLREFGTARLLKVIEESRQRSAREIVDAIFSAVQEFRGEAIPNDDMTAVAVKINA